RPRAGRRPDAAPVPEWHVSVVDRQPGPAWGHGSRLPRLPCRSRLQSARHVHGNRRAYRQSPNFHHPGAGGPRAASHPAHHGPRRCQRPPCPFLPVCPCRHGASCHSHGRLAAPTVSRLLSLIEKLPTGWSYHKVAHGDRATQGPCGAVCSVPTPLYFLVTHPVPSQQVIFSPFTTSSLTCP